MRPFRVLTVLWMLATHSLVSAHEIKVFASRQLVREGGGKTTVYLSWGHRLPVDDLVDAAPIERYDLIAPDASVSALKKEGSSLQANSVELKAAGLYTALVTRKASVYTYVLDEEGGRQLKRGPKTEHMVEKIDSATRYQQTAKAMIVVGAPGNEAPKPLGLPVEIVPLDGPEKWTTNADLRFLILVDGKPVPVAEVQARDIGFKPDDAWCYSTESNRKGEFTVRPGRAGLWVVKVNFKRLTRGAVREQYDFESYTATISLEVRP